ncbi:MAG: SSS family solute:Na+ symporter, partial [Candidatus Krumholzibacteriia bacterium]
GIAMGKVCTLAFGWPIWVGLVIPSLITAFYTLAAGYWGVVMGDFLQGIVAVFAIVLVSLVGVEAAGGAAAVTGRIVELGEGWRLDPFAFTGWFSGDFPIVWWLTMLVISILGGFGMGTSIDWYVEAQRIQSAKTVRDATYGLWVGGAVTLVRNGFWAAGILAFFAMMPKIVDQSVYELGWFQMGFQLLPTGLVGVFFGAILAIHLSTISSHLNLGALYFTRDIYQRYIQPEASEKKLVWMGRAATFVILIGSFFYGLMMQEITKWLIFALWLMMAGIWLPNILQVIWWRFNAWGYLAGWMANLGVSWLVVWILPAFGIIPKLPDHLNFWLLMALGALVFIPVTLMTKPEEMNRLVRYYVMTRPLGHWGPVHREAVRQGLIEEDAALQEEGRRPFIRRSWTPEQANTWTREDWIAIVLSPIVMGLLMIGTTKVLLLQPTGFMMLVLAIVFSGVIFWTIDPKLKAISTEYEAQQEQYVKDLEQRLRWQDQEGN